MSIVEIEVESECTE